MWTQRQPDIKPVFSNLFRANIRNPPLLVLCIANLCTLAAFNIKLAIQAHYTQYVLNDINLLSWMGFFSMDASSSAYYWCQ